MSDCRLSRLRVGCQTDFYGIEIVYDVVIAQESITKDKLVYRRLTYANLTNKRVHQNVIQGVSLKPVPANQEVDCRQEG